MALIKQEFTNLVRLKTNALSFAKTIFDWYEMHRRDLPWRNTRDPYLIWLSEIVLQQTRVNQGIGYYERLVKAYPDVLSLATAKDDEVFKLWEGLGYYKRALMMLGTAREIVNKHGGVFPDTAAGLQALKGIGGYTSAAVASFAFGEAVICVDGNVKRVASRYFGIESLYGSAGFEAEVRKHLMQVFDCGNPALFNQAIMEFGALQCKPKPECSSCPFAGECYAYSRGKQRTLPFKAEKKKVSTRYFNYFVLFSSDGKTLVKKRSGNDIWNGLFEFPMCETSNKFENHIPWPEGIGDISGDIIESVVFDAAPHKLTHRTIEARFRVIRLKNDFNNMNLANYQVIDLTQLERIAMPRLLGRYIERIKLLGLGAG